MSPACLSAHEREGEGDTLLQSARARQRASQVACQYRPVQGRVLCSSMTTIPLMHCRTLSKIRSPLAWQCLGKCSIRSHTCGRQPGGATHMS